MQKKSKIQGSAASFTRLEVCRGDREQSITPFAESRIRIFDCEDGLP